ncbi:MAG TPA: hypothetical protein VNR62_04280, partial [Cellulomonas sp.]|nr:hypothetical protein [Cellulomonas sp.]
VRVSASAARAFEDAEGPKSNPLKRFVRYLRYHADVAGLRAGVATFVLALYVPLVAFFAFLVVHAVVAAATGRD